MNFRALYGIGLSALCVAANASTFTFIGKDLGEYIQVSGVRTGTVFAGRLNFSDSDLGSVKTYCVDLVRGFGPGQSWKAATMDSQTLDDRLKMAGNIIANASGVAKTDAQAAGLQLAVWSVLYNGTDSFDISKGSFKATASANALGYAEQYFALRTKTGHSVYFKNVCTDGCGGGGEMATPEPASIGAILIGIGALVRRKKKA